MLKIEKMEFKYSDLGHILGTKALVKNMGDKALKLDYLIVSITSRRTDEQSWEERKGEGKKEQIALKPEEEKEITVSLDPPIKLKGYFSISLLGLQT